jgi:hypothetical protein
MWFCSKNFTDHHLCELAGSRSDAIDFQASHRQLVD